MIILGISGAFGHDAAAALLIDNNIISFVEEERILRHKRAVGCLPINSTIWCLQKAGIKFEDIDILALSWDSTLNEKDINLSNYISKYLRYFENNGKKQPTVFRVNHHLSHAAYHSLIRL